MGCETMRSRISWGIGRVQVSRWQGRYAKSRLAGIERDLPRGAPSVKVDVARLVELTTQKHTRSSDALEYPQDGRRTGRQCGQHLAPLARQRLEASPGTWLQGLS
jgi:hypothetical protein